MSTAMLQAPMLVIELLAAIQLIRFWQAIRRTGYFDPIISQFYPSFLADCMVLFLFVVQLLLAFQDWFGLPLEAVGIVNPSPFLPWLIFGSFFALVWMHCRGRLDHDSAQRTIAVLKAVSSQSSRIEL